MIATLRHSCFSRHMSRLVLPCLRLKKGHILLKGHDLLKTIQKVLFKTVEALQEMKGLKSIDHDVI